MHLGLRHDRHRDLPGHHQGHRSVGYHRIRHRHLHLARLLRVLGVRHHGHLGHRRVLGDLLRERQRRHRGNWIGQASCLGLDGSRHPDVLFLGVHHQDEGHRDQDVRDVRLVSLAGHRDRHLDVALDVDHRCRQDEACPARMHRGYYLGADLLGADEVPEQQA